MKKNLLYTITLAIAFITTGVVTAQNHTSLQYGVGIPMGGLKDHADNISGRGIVFEYHEHLSKQFSLGVNFGYNVFYERKDYATYTKDNQAISGVVYAYDNMFPMLVNGQYWFGGGSAGVFKPYGGLGIGTLYNLKNTDMGLYTIEEHNWHFLMTPELGFVYEIGQGVGIKLNAKYDNAFKISNDDAMGNLSFNIGFCWYGI